MTNEKMYWPGAETSDGTLLFTSDAASDLATALRQFDIWTDAYQYDIKKAWITVTPGDTKLKVEKKWVVASNAAAEKPEEDKRLTKEALAERLSGRQYKNGITSEEAREAKDNGLVVAFCYSDDCLELEGALSDEIGCFGGGKCYVTKSGVYGESNCIPFGAKEIRVLWNKGGEKTWTIETDIPHATFNVYEDRWLFCTGIVFSVEDLE